MAISARNSERSNSLSISSNNAGLPVHNSSNGTRAAYALMKLASRVSTRSGSESRRSEAGGRRPEVWASQSWSFRLPTFCLLSSAFWLGHSARNFGINSRASSAVRGETCTSPGPSANSLNTRNAVAGSRKEWAASNGFPFRFRAVKFRRQSGFRPGRLAFQQPVVNPAYVRQCASVMPFQIVPTT